MRMRKSAAYISWLEATPTAFHNSLSFLQFLTKIIGGSGILPRYKRISKTNNKASGQKMGVLKPFYQPASFLRALKVNTRQAFSVAFTFSPVTALAANEGALSW